MKLTDVPIADPCAEPDERMTKSGCNRFCHRCQKVVHDLSLMTEDAAIALLALSPPEGICVAYFADQEGNIVHQPRNPASADRPWGLVGVATLSAACNGLQPAEDNTTPAAESSQTTSPEPGQNTSSESSQTSPKLRQNISPEPGQNTSTESSHNRFSQAQRPRVTPWSRHAAPKTPARDTPPQRSGSQQPAAAPEESDAKPRKRFRGLIYSPNLR